jgi:hypothetical protein
LANGKLALMYLAIGSIDSGVYVAYCIDDNNHLQRLEISRMDQGQESARSMEITLVDQAIKRVQEQAIPLAKLASPELLQQTRDETQAYDYKKRLIPDYDSTKLYYLYTEDLSEFLGINEEGWAAM